MWDSSISFNRPIMFRFYLNVFKNFVAFPEFSRRVVQPGEENTP